ncbi:unknown [Ruminococcus sp. CAG:382]|nr:unknown [Ruminococcus sp. CAG:382]
MTDHLGRNSFPGRVDNYGIKASEFFTAFRKTDSSITANK